jgi:hypothetical protein
MPPRHAYWTILVDNLPTAFRAADREDLRPTFERLRRKHPSATMMWFARGRLWASPEAARASRAPEERRGPGWRPGGRHRDPREEFRKERQERNAARRRERFEQRQQRTDRTSAHGRDAGRSEPRGSRPGLPRDERRGDRRPHPKSAREGREGSRARESRGPAPRPPQAGAGGHGRRDAPGRRPPPARRDGWSTPAGQARAPKAGAGRPMHGAGGRRPPKPREQGGTPGRGNTRSPDRSSRGGKPPWRDARDREGGRSGAVERREGERRPRGPARPKPARSEPVKERKHPAAPPPGPPPGPDRPPRPGEEPPPVPTRADDIIAPTPPPVRGRDEDA